MHEPTVPVIRTQVDAIADEHQSIACDETQRLIFSRLAHYAFLNALGGT